MKVPKFKENGEQVRYVGLVIESWVTNLCVNTTQTKITPDMTYTYIHAIPDARKLNPFQADFTVH